ncbi:MAG: hypothetical protein WAL56_04985 [Candidatus Sulfotelmatobacter sp.]
MNSDHSKDGYLLELRRKVEEDIRSYVYAFPDNAIGIRWTDAKVADGLAQMRASLIDPYWAVVELRDTFDQVRMSNPDYRKCAAIADDGKGMVLLFDPVEESFVLAQRSATGLTTIGVRGDCVGCFLAR